MPGFHKPPMPRLQRGKLVTNGLVACWPFTEGSGDKVYDVSGRDLHGTLTGMDPNTDWISGQHGKSLNFDGTDFVNVSDNDILDLTSTDDFTWTVWFRSIQTGGSVYANIIEKRITSAPYTGYVVYTFGGKFCCHLNDTVNRVFQSYGTDLRDGKWHQYCWKVEFSNDWFNVFEDGKQVTSNISISAVTGSMINTRPLLLGGQILGSSQWIGDLGEIRCYRRALTNDEIKRIAAGLG